ncbi:hypothetical protein VXQ18_07050 [Brucella abortus]|nr:hypothetical protein [Brucella abortus]
MTEAETTAGAAEAIAGMKAAAARTAAPRRRLFASIPLNKDITYSQQREQPEMHN